MTPYFVLLTSSSQPCGVIIGSSLLRSPSKKHLAGHLGEVQSADNLQLPTSSGSASAFYQRPCCFWEAPASDWTCQCRGRGDGRAGSLPTMELIWWAVYSWDLPLSCPRLLDQCCNQTSVASLGKPTPVSSPLWSILGVSRSSQVAQTVKNLPTVWESQVQSPGQEDPLEKGMANHFSILAWEPHGQRSLAGYSSWCCKESDMTEQLTHTCRS